MQKRGQVTIFLIVGAVILVTAGLMIYYDRIGKVAELKTEGMDFNSNFFTAFVDGCLKKSAVKGISRVLAQGGYDDFFSVDALMVGMVDEDKVSFPPAVEVFEFAADEKILQVPVYFKEEKSFLPEIDFIAEETAKAVKKEFLSCVDDFESFKKQGFNIRTGEPQVEVKFAEKTIVTLDYPLAVKSRGKVDKFEKFSIAFPFNFREKYAVVLQYLSEQVKDPEYFLAGELSTAAYEKDFGFFFRQLGELGEEIVVDFSYEEYIFEEPIIYSFGLYFDWPEYAEPLEETEPFEPYIDPETGEEVKKDYLLLSRIPEWNITTGGQHNLQIEATGEEITYHTYPEGLPITSNGIVVVDTSEFPNERYQFYVFVRDKYGREVWAPLIINLNANDGRYPVIKPIGKQTAKVGEEFYLDVDVENDELVLFTTNSYLFDIDKKTGEIVFTPKESHKGNHIFRVDAENAYGKTWERWILEIN